MSKTISAAKARARHLKAHLERRGKEISLSEALEAISASENQTDWNRYQSALKRLKTFPEAIPDTGKRQPHKIFIAPPGSGSSAVAEITFVKNIMNGKIPILISLYDQKFPQNSKCDTSGWVTINTTYTREGKTNVGEALSDESGVKGILINVRLEGFPGRDLEREEKYKHADGGHFSVQSVYLTAISFIMRDILKWPEEIKANIGTIIFNGMELAENYADCTYSQRLPNLIERIRESGGNPNLFIITASHTLQYDVTVSKHEYKLIIADFIGKQRFSKWPVDQLYIEQSLESIKPTLGRLFLNPERMIEDICLYVGSLSIKLFLDDELNKGKELSFIQSYMQDIMGSTLNEMKRSVSA